MESQSLGPRASHGAGGLVTGADSPQVKWVPRGPQRASPGRSPPAHSPEGCPAPDSPPSSVQVEVPQYPPPPPVLSSDPGPPACCTAPRVLLARQRVRRGLTPVLVLSPHRHPGICSVPTSVGSPTQRTGSSPTCSLLPASRHRPGFLSLTPHFSPPSAPCIQPGSPHTSQPVSCRQAIGSPVVRGARRCPSSETSILVGPSGR